METTCTIFKVNKTYNAISKQYRTNETTCTIFKVNKTYNAISKKL